MSHSHSSPRAAIYSLTVILSLISLVSVTPASAHAQSGEVGLGPFYEVPQNSPACPANMKWVLLPRARPPHTPRPTPTPEVSPSPTPAPQASPTPGEVAPSGITAPTAAYVDVPFPRPRPIPTPPPFPNFPPEPEDPKTTGIPLIDKALKGEASPHLLPYWHNYPWREIRNPNLMTMHLYQVLSNEGADMVTDTPKDMNLLCPNYKNLTIEEKRLVWKRIISVMAEYESTFRPHRAYHSVRVQWGLYSVGLMMLSLESSTQKRFGCQSFVKGYDDLYDWRKSLQCSVRIMNHYYAEDHSLTGRTSFNPDESRWMGVARYFEMYRDQRFRKAETAGQVLDDIRSKRRKWLKEAMLKQTPALRDEQYRAAGERDLEKLARLVGTMPFCMTGTPDDFLDEVQGAPPGPYMCVPL